MSLQVSVPGKILIVDDQLTPEIEKTIVELATKGFSVQYWNSKDGTPSSIYNVRTLILDLDLSAGTIPRGDKSFYYLAAEVLNKIKGPYVVLIFSRDFIQEDVDNLKAVYEELYEHPIEGFVEGISGLAKDAGFETILEKLNEISSASKVLQLILLWEKILDNAKDYGLSKFLKEKFENEIDAFVKSIGRDVGTDSLPREFIANMMRFVSRYMHGGSEYESLSKLLLELYTSSTTPTVSDRLLQHRSMYFTPVEKEQVWTGDIFKLEEITVEDPNGFWKYYIVLTPECNIAHANFDSFLVCRGFALDQTSLSDTVNHPIYKMFKVFQLPNREGISAEKYEEKVTISFKNKPERLCPLWNFSEKDEEYFGICFDLMKVTTIPKKEFNEKFKNSRVCRLDFPFINELMQKFANYNSRIGTPVVNTPHYE